MNNLKKSFKSSPKYSIKWSNYFEIYENLFKRFKNKKITLVEVGIGNGGSLFMWRNYFGKKAKIIGVELNPEAKKLEKNGFKVCIGDQSNPVFWKNFYKKFGKIDILIDDGGHTNLQQITTLMESMNHINYGGMIVVEDTHTSFMRDKGFKNPSKYSFINFSSAIIEILHRRNPMIKKKLNHFSKIINSIEYFDSITVINIARRRLTNSKNLENNKKLRIFFDDFRFRKESINNNQKKLGFFLDLIKKKISKRSYLYKIYENILIKRYLKIFKK
mgnify:CR=1 FL=1|tara:strand:+ start:365 stop:1186 length:822 start_codon:yes stop_codon:yes gene_type:complete